MQMFGSYKDFSLPAYDFKKEKNLHKEKAKPAFRYLSDEFLSASLTEK
jgi:hypothetical protein